MDVNAYLARIGLAAPVEPTLEGLRAVHRAHLLAAPFENLHVQLGRPVTTEIGAIYEKIVEARRGGWCYEMNGLLGWALQELGFAITRTAAGVMREMSGDAAVGNHLTLQVHLPDGVYLADVGFGDGPIAPFRLAEGEFDDGRFSFGLSQQEGGWWRFHNHRYGGAKSFDFRPIPADEALLTGKCAYLQTAEASPFVQNLVCQRHTDEGFASLRGRIFREVTPQGIASERLLESADDLVSTLRDRFGLDALESATLWPNIMDRHATLFGDRAGSPAPH